MPFVAFVFLFFWGGLMEEDQSGGRCVRAHLSGVSKNSIPGLGLNPKRGSSRLTSQQLCSRQSAGVHRAKHVPGELEARFTSSMLSSF